MEDKKVAILMASFDGEKYIKEQIDSILNQTYKNIDIYISDDNSTDNTINIIKEYVNNNNNIKYLQNDCENSGAKNNFANVFDKVNGYDYYMFCDQDDFWYENKVEHIIEKAKELEKNEEFILIYNDLCITDSKLEVKEKSLINKEHKYLPKSKVFNHFLVQAYFPGCAMTFNDKLKQKVKNIADCAEMHDWWVALIAAYYGNIFFLNEPLQLYRQHENNVVGSIKNNNILSRIKKLTKLKEEKQIWKKYQNTVLLQAKEILNNYEPSHNLDVLNRFIVIMETKSKLWKLLQLKRNEFSPIEHIRILRLVL